MADQPRLVPDLNYAVSAVQVSMRWIWPEGWRVRLAIRKEGQDEWTVTEQGFTDSEHALRVLTDRLAVELGVA